MLSHQRLSTIPEDSMHPTAYRALIVSYTLSFPLGFRLHPSRAKIQEMMKHQKRPLHTTAKGEIPRYHLYSLPDFPAAISMAFNGLHPGAVTFFLHRSGSKATFRPICSQTAFQPPGSSLCRYKGRTPLFLSLFYIVFNNSGKKAGCQGGADIKLPP